MFAKYYEIPFTRYTLPNGKTSNYMFQTTRSDVYDKAKSILSTGTYKFEIEILTTGEVSATIHNKETEVDVAIAVELNVPELAEAIEQMIINFDVDKDDSKEE